MSDDLAATPPAWLDELPLAPGPPWHAMGTRALDESSWLVADDRRDVELAAKRRLLDTAPAVVSAKTAGAAVADACAEAAALVAAAAGVALEARRSPLEAAAVSVQEDLCLLVRHGDGTWRLDAGVVCFPSMWRLPDKIGLPLAAVHEPVPAYADELAARVDAFLGRLRTERPVWRRNWFVHETTELHLPAPPPPPPDPPGAPDGLWLRSERQTLRRLPRTGAILFTIRTQQAPFAVFAQRPDLAPRLAAAIRSWSDDLVAYRGAGRWLTPALSWLDALAPVAPDARR